MIIEYKCEASRDPYYTVAVEKDELVTASGKKLSYPTWIGTVSRDGKITLWYPASYRPRDYEPQARKMLEFAKEQINKVQSGRSQVYKVWIKYDDIFDETENTDG